MILAGDIGGTKALLALHADDALDPVFEQRYASREFADFESLLARFLAEAGAALRNPPRVEAACLGVAGPVLEERVAMTNLPWVVSGAQLRARFAITRVRLLNDFAAAAWGVGLLAPGDRVTLQAGEPLPPAPRVVLGAGTGLGIAYVFADGDGTRAIPGEGGHGAFAPASEEQIDLWRHLQKRVGRVTLEHVLSGAGLARIHEFVRERGGFAQSVGLGAMMQAADPAAVIAHHAIERADPLACAVLDLFIACYGAAAGDHALNVMARGGVFVAGGIAPKILPRLRTGGFVAAFNDKGVYSGHVRRIPVHVVINERLGLIGAAAAARNAARCATRGAGRSKRSG